MDPVLQSFVDAQQAILTGIVQLDAANSQISGIAADLQAQLNKANADLSAAQAQIADLTQQVSAQTANNQILAERLAAAQVQYNSLAAQVASLQAQLLNVVPLQDVLTGKVAPTVFSALQTHKRSPQVVGTTVNQDQEIMLQWGDAGGTKADSNPGTVVKPHGTAVYVQGTSTSPAHIAFNPAAANDNLFLFMDLPTPAVAPKLFYSSRTYQCTAAEAAALTCPESDSQYEGAGWIYNFGVQLNPAGWRFFHYNKPSGDWVLAPGIPMVDFVSAPVKYDVISSIDTVAHTVTRIAIRINNGDWVPVGLTFPAFNTGRTTSKYTAAVQLDSKGAPAGSVPPPTGITVIDAEERYL